MYGTLLTAATKIELLGRSYGDTILNYGATPAEVMGTQYLIMVPLQSKRSFQDVLPTALSPSYR